jgi:adenosylhomocysteine nucleosidase
MLIVCPMEAERGLVPALGAHVIGLGAACVSGLDSLESPSTSHILVIGLAGSLTPFCVPGSVYAVGSVIDSAGRVYESNSPYPMIRLSGSGVRIACADSLVSTPSAKAELATATGACLVDMESAHVARWCVSHGRSWSMVRAVLDGHDETLPPAMEHWCGPDGRMRYLRVLISVLANPLILGQLPWLARARHRAGTALREVF